MLATGRRQGHKIERMLAIQQTILDSKSVRRLGWMQDLRWSEKEKPQDLVENTHTLYLFRTKFKLVSCVRQIDNGIYGDDSTWQFFNFADKTGRVWVRGLICMKVDKVKLENQLRIVF